MGLLGLPQTFRHRGTIQRSHPNAVAGSVKLLFARSLISPSGVHFSAHTFRFRVKNRSAGRVRSIPPRMLKALRAESTGLETFAIMDKPLGKYIHTPSILPTTKGFHPC
jgi:hypothetical protein